MSVLGRRRSDRPPHPLGQNRPRLTALAVDTALRQALRPPESLHSPGWPLCFREALLGRGSRLASRHLPSRALCPGGLFRGLNPHIVWGLACGNLVSALTGLSAGFPNGMLARISESWGKLCSEFCVGFRRCGCPPRLACLWLLYDALRLVWHFSRVRPLSACCVAVPVNSAQCYSFRGCALKAASGRYRNVISPSMSFGKIPL